MSIECKKLHEIFNKMKRFRFPFDESKIPENGVYILFEKGELAHDGDRIVRIGTHTGETQLLSRLKQHFIKENKDRSIFRKSIGRAILNKIGDPFLCDWEKDLTTKEARNQFRNIDLEKQKEIERKISKYIQENFSFGIIPVENKEQRLELESKIISTISLCQECKPSENWLGINCPSEKLQTRRVYENCLKIKNFGLWNVNELKKQPLTKKEIEVIHSLI